MQQGEQPDAQQAYPRTFYIALVISVCLSMIAVDSMIPALPLIVQGLGVGQAQAPLLVTTYLAGYAMAQIPVGLLSDRFGRRHVMLIGLAVFELTALAAALASDLHTFLIARFVMGLAGATGPVVGRAVLRDTHHGKDLGRVMAMLVAVLSAGTMLAPLTGTVLVYLAGWQAPLWVPAVITAIAFALVLSSVPESHKPRRDVKFVRQVVDSASIFFRSGTSVRGTLLLGSAFFGYFVLSGTIGSLMVSAYHLPADRVGWFFAGAAFFYMVAGSVCRRLIETWSAMRLMLIGATLFGLCLIFSVFAWWWGPINLVGFSVFLVTYFIGLGLVFAPVTAVTLEPVPTIAGFAASILGSFQMAMGMLATWVSARLYDGSSETMMLLCSVGSLVFIVTLSALYRHQRALPVTP